MKYILVEWPEIQDYMDNPDYPDKCYFDPDKNVWFVPEIWSEWLNERNEWDEYIEIR